MATGGKILNELQDEFCECPICTEEYDEDKHVPRLLPCQHSFCTECLTKGVRRNKLVCSMCKKSYNLKEKGIEIFPKDLTRRNLKDILGRLAVNSCTVCRRLESVRFQCTVCNNNLCKACYKLRKSSECKTHSFKEIQYDDKETPDSSLDSLETNSKDICTIKGHENNTLKFYCKNKQCRKSICSNCATKEHKKHEWEELDAVYSCRKDLLISRLSTAKKKVESAEKVKSLYDNNRGKVEQNLISTIQMINKEKQEGVDYLNQVSEEICQTYKNTAEKLTADHDKELQYLQAYIENASECCSISEQLLKENKVAFLSVEKTISDKLEIFGTESFDYKKCDVNMEQFLLEGRLETLKRKVATLKEDLLRHNDVRQLSIIGVDEKGQPLVRFTKKQSTIKENVSMIKQYGTFLLVIMTCVAALFFVVREYNTWWNLSLCEMEKCDETVLSFTNSTNHSSFCRFEDGNLAESFSKRTDCNQRCGNINSLFITQGVLLNQTVRFFKEYDILKFRIRLSDFSKLSYGQQVLTIGFSSGSFYKGANDNGFEWGLVHSEDGEWIELVNPTNSVVARISVATKARLVLNYDLQLDDASRTITVLNRQNKKVLDSFEITDTYSECIYIYLKLFEKSMAKTSVTSLSKGVGFYPESTYSGVYTSTDNTTVRNYVSVGERYIYKPLIQDIEVYNCTWFCVIPITMIFERFPYDSDDSFELYLARFDHTDEVLLLSTVEWNSYINSAIEYLFGTHPTYLSLNPYLNENMRIVPNSLIASGQSVLIVDKGSDRLTLNIHFYGYTFPIPQLLYQKEFILRFKVKNAMKLTVKLENPNSFPYMYYILSPCLNNTVVEFYCSYLMYICLLMLIYLYYDCKIKRSVRL